jgi:hypothetical protein
VHKTESGVKNSNANDASHLQCGFIAGMSPLIISILFYSGSNCVLVSLQMRAEELEMSPTSYIIGGSSNAFQKDQIMLESFDSRGKSLLLRKQTVNDWMVLVLVQKNGMKQLRKIVELNPSLAIDAFSFATTVAVEYV